MINKEAEPRPEKIKLTKKQAMQLENTLVDIVKQHLKGWKHVGLSADFKSIVAVRDTGEVMAYHETVTGTNYLSQVVTISIADIVKQIKKAV